MKARSKIQSDYMGHRIQTYTNNTQLSTEIIRVYPVEDGLDDVKIVYIPLGHQAVNDFQRLSVEYRKNYALDKVGAYGQSGPAPAGIYLYNRYHKMIDYTLDTDDFWDGAMRAGDSLDLMSSYGVKIEVLSETSEFAEIKVTRNGIGICQKSNPSVVYSQNGVYSKSATPGETVEFASGGLDSYLKIRNNDIGPCEPRTLRRSNQSTPLNWDVYTIAGEPELDPLPFSVGSWNFNVKPGQEKVYFNYVNQGLLMDVPQDACNRTYTTRLYIEQLDFPFQFNTSFKVNVFDGEECDDEKK
jgi:hypothetical protein